MMSSIYTVEKNINEQIDHSEMYPYDLYSKYRDKGDLIKVGDGWLALSYDAVQEIFVDRRFETVHPSEMAPDMILGDMNRIIKAILTPPLKFIINRQVQTKLTEDWMLFNNPPKHTRIRRIAQAAFTPKAIEAMRPKIEKVTNDLLDLLEDKTEFDLITEFSYPLPIAIIAEILGLSEDNSEEFKDWSQDIINGFKFDAGDGDTREKANIAIEGTVEILEKEVAYREDNRGDDVISNFLNARDEEGNISQDEIISNLILLLIAGHETTVNLINNTVYALLTHLDQFDLLKSDPSLLENTIEESLRFDPPLNLTNRVAGEDMDFHGYPLKEGDQIEVSINAANRDPRKFENPDTFDITRDNSRRHLAFGKGIHYCLGAPLARLEAEIAFDAFIKRFPDISLVEDNPPERAENFPLSTFGKLPLKK